MVFHGQQCRWRRPVLEEPFPGQPAAALLQVEDAVDDAVMSDRAFEVLGGREVMVDHRQLRGASRHRLDDRARIGEIHEIGFAAVDRGRRIAMRGGLEIHVTVAIEGPDDPGGGEAVGA